MLYATDCELALRREPLTTLLELPGEQPLVQFLTM